MQPSAQVPPPVPEGPEPVRLPALPAELAGVLEALRAGRGGEREAGVVAEWLRPRLGAYFAACRVAEADRPDLVQNVLRRVLSGMSGLRELARFEPWLFTIARNVVRSRLERRAHDPLGRAEELDSAESGGRLRAAGADPEARLLAAERVAVVERALRALPARQRQCLLLRVRQELSYEEIGALLALSAHTVRNHLAEARARLRGALAATEAGP